MTDYWPSNIDLEDTANPHEILLVAKDQWDVESGGQLTLLIQETESTSGDSMLIVHAKHVPSNRTITLFSVIYRPEGPYPTRIKPREEDLPNYLKKSYYRPGIAEIASIKIAGSGQVENEWVCDTPAEFRDKLKRVFNLGVLKSEVLNLVSGFNPKSVEADSK